MKEIVIKLSDERYELLQAASQCVMSEEHIAILTGTILPKGHGDLVDRDEILDYRMNKILSSWGDAIMYADAIIEADGGNENG